MENLIIYIMLVIFYIGGFIENKNREELSKINKLFQDYNNNYDKISLPFNDKEYLNLNS